METSKDQRIILPGSTVGVLGGGQLGRMIALEGRKMGYRFITLDPTEDSPCGQVCDDQVIASFGDVEAARILAKSCDVVTYEFENVDSRVAEVLEQESYVPQGSKLLFITQHRVREKSTMAQFGIPVTPFRPVFSYQDMEAGALELGYPCVLKTSTGGYDGKGQWLLKSETDAKKAFDEAAQHIGCHKTSGEAEFAPLIVEQFIPFRKELSVIVARNLRGEVRPFPVAENEHRDHILHMSTVPAQISAEVEENAYGIATRIAQAFELIGLIAVELFLTDDDKLYVNELAPRPHNSGHYTFDACVTSQFEQHLRAICNLPLGDVRLLSPVVMVNLLGKHLDAFLGKIPTLDTNIKIHLYGKKDNMPKRKMGHINVLAPSTEVALSQVRHLGIW